MLRQRLALVLGCLVLCWFNSAFAEERLALVIGNATYPRSQLKNSVNDARAVASSLRSLGFEVIERENTTWREIITALQEFSIRARKSDVRLLYYAGHGVQVRGRNYLIPVDAQIASEDEVSRQSADVNDLLDRLADLRSGVNIIILDACRNNPFLGTPVVSSDGRSVRARGIDAGVGLAKVEAPLGTVVAYATSPGSVAIDPEAQANSIYTKHLLVHIATVGLPIEQLFKRIRIDVARETQNLQVPWESSSLVGNFCFRPAAGNRCGD